VKYCGASNKEIVIVEVSAGGFENVVLKHVRGY